MNLDDLLNEMSEKMRNRDLSDEYLRKHDNSTREEIGIGEYAYGITMIPCKWVYKYLSDYKRALKENEELLELKVSASAHNRILKLEKENEELKENNKYIIRLTDEQYNVVIENAQNDIKQKWIQKAKDKIEKLNDESHAEELEDIMIGKNYTITELVQYVLQELIEESEEK